MGKRSNFVRNPRDFYSTPAKPVERLINYLPTSEFTFSEPCAGDGRLSDHIMNLCPHAKCVAEYDIEPMNDRITKSNAFNQEYKSDLIITNPPWDRTLLHDMIMYFSDQAPTWLLFDADWMHTQQSAPFMQYCNKIITVGRVKWIEDSRKSGKDNVAWYLFDKNSDQESPTFIGWA